MATTDDTGQDNGQRSALWLTSLRAPLRVGPAPARRPGATEVVVRARAVAINPIDAMGGLARRVVLPWLRYPAVLGSDVAGEVTAVGSAVSTLAVGDRVVGYAVGVERSRNNPAEGAFQTHVTLMEHMCSPLPSEMTFERAAVLPLALTTAAAGLFEEDQLALDLPCAVAPERGQTVLVFGGATSVGMNAIQLARSAGYRVVATASPDHAEVLTELGAAVVVDYHDPDMIRQIISEVSIGPLAGTLAIASGTLRDAIVVNRSSSVIGPRRISSAHPTPDTKIRALLARPRGISVSANWGGSPKDTAVGPAIWQSFLPAALAEHRYRAAPEPLVTGQGLEAIPSALAQLRIGVRATKLVVTL